MGQHPLLHFFWTLGLLGVVAAAAAAIGRPAVRRRLVFAEILLLAALAVHTAVLQLTGIAVIQQHGPPVEYFLIACGLISAGVALVNMGPTPIYAKAVVDALAAGASAADAAEHAADDASPTSDLNASPEYRTHLAKVLTRRALESAGA